VRLLGPFRPSDRIGAAPPMPGRRVLGDPPRVGRWLAIYLRDRGDDLWFVGLQTLLPTHVFQRVVVDQDEHLVGIGDAGVGRGGRRLDFLHHPALAVQVGQLGCLQ